MVVVDGEMTACAAEVKSTLNAGGPADVFVMNADGSGRKQLTCSPANDVFPAWSPDGKVIAFTSWMGRNCNICLINADQGAEGDLA